MPGRKYSVANTKYRYGFNGKENDNEVKGDGNQIDFEARLYDSRLSKWLSVDPMQKKYAGWSPYHFGYDNPIITIDKDGKENIVVVGGIDIHGGDPLKFINSGLRQIYDFVRQQPSEQTTMVLMTAHMSKYQVAYTATVINALHAINPKFNIVTVSSGQELANYMNSKNASNSKLSNERINDKITDISFFGHGLKDRGFDPGYSRPLGSSIRESFNFSTEEIKSLNSNAFQDAKTGVYSCNSATLGNNGKSFVQEFSSATKGTVFGWESGKTDYEGIYNSDNKDRLSKFEKLQVLIHFAERTDDDLFKEQIRTADNYPTPGSSSDQSKIHPAKVTYSNGKETKREN